MARRLFFNVFTCLVSHWRSLLINHDLLDLPQYLDHLETREAVKRVQPAGATLTQKNLKMELQTESILCHLQHWMKLVHLASRSSLSQTQIHMLKNDRPSRFGRPAYCRLSTLPWVGSCKDTFLQIDEWFSGSTWCNANDSRPKFHYICSDHSIIQSLL